MMNTQASLGGKSNNMPLNLSNPFALIVFLVFYSPIIIATCIFSSSFFYQNWGGIVYLLFLIGVSLLREGFIYATQDPNKPKYKSSNDICDMVQYSYYGNTGYSIFVLSFTLMYLCLPMFMSSNVNYFILIPLLIYLMTDIGIRSVKQCYKPDEKYMTILSNLLSGGAIGTLMTGALYTTGASKYLVFSDSDTSSSNSEKCSMPSKQKFKCSVYKNGELVGQTNQ